MAQTTSDWPRPASPATKTPGTSVAKSSSRATVLIPNLMPYGQRLQLSLYSHEPSHATLRWNGDVVDDADLAAGWTKLTFDLPDIALHTNELAIEAPAGTGVSDLELGFLPR